MANTFNLISAVTVASGGSSTITFSSIPATYTDLCLKISGRGGSGSSWIAGIDLTFNSSRTTNLRRLFSVGSSVYSDTNVGGGQGEGGLMTGTSATTSTFGSIDLYIPNYQSTAAKSYSIDYVVENNSSTDASVGMFEGLNSSVTSAITSITLSTSGYSFVQFSTAYLYGIKSS